MVCIFVFLLYFGVPKASVTFPCPRVMDQQQHWQKFSLPSMCSTAAALQQHLALVPPFLITFSSSPGAETISSGLLLCCPGTRGVIGHFQLILLQVPLLGAFRRLQGERSSYLESQIANRVTATSCLLPASGQNGLVAGPGCAREMIFQCHFRFGIHTIHQGLYLHHQTPQNL